MTVLHCSWLKIECELTLYRPMCFEALKSVSFSDRRAQLEHSIVHQSS